MLWPVFWDALGCLVLLMRSFGILWGILQDLLGFFTHSFFEDSLRFPGPLNAVSWPVFLGCFGISGSLNAILWVSPRDSLGFFGIFMDSFRHFRIFNVICSSTTVKLCFIGISGCPKAILWDSPWDCSGSFGILWDSLGYFGILIQFAQLLPSIAVAWPVFWDSLGFLDALRRSFGILRGILSSKDPLECIKNLTDPSSQTKIRKPKKKKKSVPGSKQLPVSCRSLADAHLIIRHNAEPGLLNKPNNHS